MAGALLRVSLPAPETRPASHIFLFNIHTHFIHRSAVHAKNSACPATLSLGLNKYGDRSGRGDRSAPRSSQKNILYLFTQRHTSGCGLPTRSANTMTRSLLATEGCSSTVLHGSAGLPFSTVDVPIPAVVSMVGIDVCMQEIVVCVCARATHVVGLAITAWKWWNCLSASCRTFLVASRHANICQRWSGWV